MLSVPGLFSTGTGGNETNIMAALAASAPTQAPSTGGMAVSSTANAANEAASALGAANSK